MPKGRRRSISSSRWKQFHHLALTFKNAAELAREFDYLNASGVLIAHSAIAFTDALCVKVGGVKSGSEDHYQAVVLVRELLDLDKEGRRALDHYVTIIQEKSLVSYSGEIYRLKEVNKLWKHLERYQKWIESILKA